MFCTECGNALANNSEICDKCNARTPKNDGSPFKAMFDFSFESFITVTLVKIVYIIALILIVVFGLFVIFATLDDDYMSAAAKFGIIFFGVPIAVATMTLVARIYLEFIVVIFRIADHTKHSAELLAAANNSDKSQSKDQ